MKRCRKLPQIRRSKVRHESYKWIRGKKTTTKAKTKSRMKEGGKHLARIQKGGRDSPTHQLHHLHEVRSASEAAEVGEVGRPGLQVLQSLPRMARRTQVRHSEEGEVDLQAAAAAGAAVTAVVEEEALEADRVEDLHIAHVPLSTKMATKWRSWMMKSCFQKIQKAKQKSTSLETCWAEGTIG